MIIYTSGKASFNRSANIKITLFEIGGNSLYMLHCIHLHLHYKARHWLKPTNMLISHLNVS